MGEQVTNFLVIVLLPTVAVFLILKVGGFKTINALMWAAIFMAVVAGLIWLTVST